LDSPARKPKTLLITPQNHPTFQKKGGGERRRPPLREKKRGDSACLSWNTRRRKKSIRSPNTCTLQTEKGYGSEGSEKQRGKSTRGLNEEEGQCEKKERARLSYGPRSGQLLLKILRTSPYIREGRERKDKGERSKESYQGGEAKKGAQVEQLKRLQAWHCNRDHHSPNHASFEFVIQSRVQQKKGGGGR